MDVHDVGGYGKKMSRPFEPGMVLTIEPGIYIAAGDQEAPAEYRGIGVRIEDDILITDDGNDNLTRAIPKTVEEVERACQDLREMVASTTYELDLLFTRFGGIAGKALFGAFLSRCIETKTGEKSLTFEQLYQHTGRVLTVTVLGLTNNTIEYMTRAEHPGVDVALAVTASCAIPLVFTPVLIGPHMYVDPAIVEVAALEQLDTDPSAMVLTIDAEKKKGAGRPQKLTSYIELVMSSIANVQDKF